MEKSMADSLLLSLTPESLRELMQQAGYRAELMTDRPNVPYLRSATGGVPFEVQFMNRMPSGAEGYADVTFVVVLGVQGDMPLAALNDWNNIKRFGRLRLVQKLLVLDMDVTAVGGVTPLHLRATISIWDQLLQDLQPFLRNALVKIAAANAATQGSAVVEAPTGSPVTPAEPAPARPRSPAKS